MNRPEKVNYHGPLASDTRARYRDHMRRFDRLPIDPLARLSHMLRTEPARYKIVRRYHHNKREG